MSRQTNCSITDFPDELFVDIFSLVSVGDLCNISLVSKRLNSVANDQALWKQVCPTRKKLDKEGASKFFNDCNHIMGRFSKLYLGGLSGIKLSEEDVQGLLKHIKSEFNNITEVDFFSNNLSQIPPGLLGETVVSLNKVDLRMVKVTRIQLYEIFVQIKNKEPLNLIELSLEGTNLSKFEPNLLADAVSKLVKVNLTDTDLSTDQLLTILNRIKDSNTPILKSLSLNLLRLYRVPDNVLTGAVAKLESVELQSTGLSANQITEILSQMLKSSNLKHLSVADNCQLRDVSDQIRERAQQKMPNLLQKTSGY